MSEPVLANGKVGYVASFFRVCDDVSIQVYPCVSDLGDVKGRGYDDWQGGKITRKQFVDRLAMEWAGLPNTTGKSHYHGDGLNRATIRLRELLQVLPQPETGGED